MKSDGWKEKNKVWVACAFLMGGMATSGGGGLCRLLTVGDAKLTQTLEKDAFVR